jgi:hypothetical protein
VEAADLEDVGHVHPETDLDLDRLRRLGVIDDVERLEQAVLDASGPGQAELAPGEVDGPLVVGIAPDLGVRQLDRVDAVGCVRAAQDGQRMPIDPDDGRRQDPRVKVVETQSPTVDPDVPPPIGEQVDVAVLRDLDAAEIGRRDDMRGRRRDGS